ncbi:MAG: bifunctional precorrin-2 dehydrogenase/sirohydrochlorin ferrochelatase [Planctomycetes bacterium]|nr:bifunctional precorrin-2 dehydrogenase/sirohydrochlorin ferrochelatase [Planctomycetota bacterium]
MSKNTPRYYPINLDIAGRKCVVVGGGKVALRKVRSLLDAGGRVVLISPGVSGRLPRAKALRLARRRYRASDLKNAALVIAATDDHAVNRKVSSDARKRNIPVNVVDQPDLCTFIVPACVRRGRLTLAVSTGGASPLLASHIRKEIETTYGPEYADLVNVIGELRDEVIRKVPDAAIRRELFEKMSSPKMLKRLREKGKRSLRAALRKLVAEA